MNEEQTTPDQDKFFSSTEFFATPFAFNTRMTTRWKGVRHSLSRVALVAGLAAATGAYSSAGQTNADFAAAIISPRAIVGYEVKAAPLDWLASINAHHQARDRAIRVVKAGLGMGSPPPDRVVETSSGGVAIYWLSRQLTVAGAAVRYALFECEKDGTSVVLSDHDPKREQLFDVKHGNYRELVVRAVAYVA